MKKEPPASTARPSQKVAISTIWHLTDLHLDPKRLPGSADGKHIPVGASTQDFAVDYWSALEEFAARKPADIVVFTGDAVDAPAVSAKPRTGLFHRLLSFGLAPATPASEPLGQRKRAFEHARDLIQRIAGWHQLNPELNRRVVVCPGNHDVDWAASGKDGDASRRAFMDAMSKFLTPQSKKPFVTLSQLGIKIACFDTCALEGRQFDFSGHSVRLGAPSAPLRMIRELLERSGKTRESLRVGSGELGIVVQHHPPGSVMAPAVELKAFEIAIAAEQAKRELCRAGYRVFLHGHHHTSLARTEHSYVITGGADAGQKAVVIGAEDMYNGFNVLECAVSLVTGEARLRIQPYRVRGNALAPVGNPWLMSVDPPYSSPIGAIQVVERINEHGDARTDTYFHEVPLPPHPHRGGGGEMGELQDWVDQDGAWVRDIPRVIAAPVGKTAAPICCGLTADTEASFVTTASRDRNNTIEGKLRVRVQRRGGGSVSVLERTITNAAYAVSQHHQARQFGAPSLVRGQQAGWECTIFVQRVPAKRLEIMVRLPFQIDTDIEVELLTGVELEDGTIAPDFRLLDFTEVTVEKALKAKRIRASVKQPLTGVSYVLRWRLPPEHPTLLDLTSEHRRGYSLAVEAAERLLERLTGARRSPQIIQRYHDAFEKFTLAWSQWLGGHRPSDIEWSLLVPSSPIPTFDDLAAGHEFTVAPTLVCAVANFPAGDPRWGQDWRVGASCAGRAYSVNQSVYYTAPARRPGVVTPEIAWASGDLSPYEPNPDGSHHEWLYCVPVTHPTRPDVVFAVACLGGYDRESKLYLEAQIPGDAWGGLGMDETLLREGSTLGAELYLRHLLRVATENAIDELR